MIKGFMYWGLPQETLRPNDLTRYRMTNNTILLLVLLTSPLISFSS